MFDYLSALTFSSSNKRSLSRIIESYLKSLVNRNKNNDEFDIGISPFVKSMSTGVEIPTDLDYKSEFLDHLIEKQK
jgi:hypothetical protein